MLLLVPLSPHYIMTDWMEILGVTSAFVGLLIAIPAIYHAVKTLYRRIHRVGVFVERLKGGGADLPAGRCAETLNLL